MTKVQEIFELSEKVSKIKEKHRFFTRCFLFLWFLNDESIRKWQNTEKIILNFDKIILFCTFVLQIMYFCHLKLYFCRLNLYFCHLKLYFCLIKIHKSLVLKGFYDSLKYLKIIKNKSQIFIIWKNQIFSVWISCLTSVLGKSICSLFLQAERSNVIAIKNTIKSFFNYITPVLCCQWIWFFKTSFIYCYFWFWISFSIMINSYRAMRSQFSKYIFGNDYV